VAPSDAGGDDLRARIAHLYRRAGFGARPDELDAAAAAGYEATVDRLLEVAGPDPGVDAMAPPKVTPYAGPAAAAAGLTDAQRQAAQKAAQQDLRQQTQAVGLWWLDRMVLAQRPLREKLALFWHGHFATSVQKVKDAELMYAQNQTFRTLGAGNFEALAQAVAKGPALMVYLDSNQNRKASANENMSRELLELFTVGIGNYTEDDVKNGARGLTGLLVNRQTGNVTLNRAQHDDGTKTYLGSTGTFGPDDIVHLAVSSPASAPFITSRIWSHFARPAKPDDPVVRQLAPAFARDLDVSNLLRAVFLHPEFVAPATRTGLVKQPVEYVAGTLRALGQKPSAVKGLLAELDALGQEPFQPPDVGGWPQNTYWLNTSFSLSRLRFASAVAQKADVSSLASAPVADRPRAAATLLSVDGWSPTTAAALATAASEPKALLTLALVAPEYVLA
jgi:uncharacterized protein (DUF1800 family)